MNVLFGLMWLAALFWVIVFVVQGFYFQRIRGYISCVAFMYS